MIEVLLPRLGWDMEAGSLVEWVKKDGDAVEPGDVICLIEGDKAVTEVESMDGGILRIPPDSPAPGERVPVGTVLAYLLETGETAPFDSGASAAANAATVGPSATGARRRAGPPISPRARRIARDLGIDPAGLQPSGDAGRVSERDVRAAARQLTQVAPAAASVFANVAATGILTPPPGMEPITAAPAAVAAPATVETVAPAAPPAAVASPDAGVTPPLSVPPPAAPPVAPPPEPVAAAEAVPFAGVRELTARRLGESARTTVPVTLTTEADATALVRLRERIKLDLTTGQRGGAGAPPVVPTITDLIARPVALALTEHPALNASLDGDRIVRHAAVHLGVAVDTDRGLLVPVIRHAERASVQALAAESARLVEAARRGRLAADEMRGGTFTITNLGMYEIDAFTPVINLPECAILGVGRIVARQVVVDERAETVAVRRMVALSLTFDHRLVDGAPAARFLQRVKQFIERPTLWLIR